MQFRTIIAALVLYSSTPALSFAGYADPAVSVIVSSESKPTFNQPIVVYAGSNTSVLMTATAANFTPTSYTWTQVSDVSNKFASAGTATFTTVQAGNKAVKATLSAKGVYQFQVTATDGTRQASRYVWVNVWDSVPALQGNGIIGRNPGVDPPDQVRPLSADPGPLCHPRVLFSRDDWTELNAKDFPAGGANPAPDAAVSTATLVASLQNHFDKAGDPLNKLAQAFLAYASSGYEDPGLSNLNAVYAANAGSLGNDADPNSNNGGTLGNGNVDNSFYNSLLVACYLQWVGNNPNAAHDPNSAAGIRSTYLATVAAAAAHYEEYTSLYNLKKDFPGPDDYRSPHDTRIHPDGNIAGLSGNGVNANNQPLHPYVNLGLTYDFIYDWMTPTQQSDTRDYLFTISNFYITQGLQPNAPAAAPNGTGQNGDFSVLSHGLDIPGLAIEGEEGLLSADPINYNGPYTPAPDTAAAWPFANNTSVLNMQALIHFSTEFDMTPWGFYLTMMDYFQLAFNVGAPSVVATSRRGENGWVTTNLYQVHLHGLYNLSSRESDGADVLFDHHDGGGFGDGPNSNVELIIAKYMYPTDPLIDYVYRAFLADMSNKNLLYTTGGSTGNDALASAMFSVAPLNPAPTLAQVGAQKNLLLTKLDPFRGTAISRNGWDSKDMHVEFENRYDTAGHNHGERNSFAFHALGRTWACAPGYHVTISDVESQVMIQEAGLDTTDASQGYIGTSPNSYFQARTNPEPDSNVPPLPPVSLDKTDPRYGGPFSGQLLSATEEPGKLWTWFAGDAKSAYDYVAAGNRTVVNADNTETSVTTDAPTSYTLASRLMPGALANLIPDDQSRFLSSVINGTPYNPVQYAFRSVFTARGTYPYAIIVDDIRKDNAAHNYRWTMSCAVNFSNGRFVDAKNNSVFASLDLDPASPPTSTQAVLLHNPIDLGTKAGLPRLLVRDLNGSVPGTNVPAGAPVAEIEDLAVPSPHNDALNLTYGYDNNSHSTDTPVATRRLFIDRPGVVSPNYKVLLFPFYTGGLTPTTSWNSDGTVLTVQVGSQTDKIMFDYSNADHRTRLVSFNRTEGHAAPTLTMPANVVVPANGFTADGQPGGSATFTLKATDYLGSNVSVAANYPSGTVFPSGLTTVQLSAIDSLGQETVGSFTVTVIPGAPLVTIQAIKNIAASGSNYGITLGWPAMLNVTGYNVKRATSATGTFVNVSTNQSLNTFTDSGLANTAYYYKVTALYNSYEGTPSVVVSLPLMGLGAFTGSGLGTVVGDGAYKNGNSYVLTNSSGGIGGGGEQATFVSMPWSGDGSFTARLAGTAAPGSSVSVYASFALMMRQNTSSNSLMAASGYGPFVQGLYFSERNSTTTSAVTTANFTGSSVPVPVWSRLVRSGNLFKGYYSYDGETWILIASPDPTMTPGATVPMTSPALVGFAVGAGGSTATTATYDNVVFLGTPTIIPQGGNSLKLDWSGAQAASYSVQRATGIDGDFQTIASGLTATNYPDTPSVAGNYYYTVTAYGTDGGTTVSPIVGGLRNRAVGGTATASKDNPPNESAAMAFDSVTSTKWFNNNGGTTGWLAYQFTGGLSWVVTQYTVSSANDVPGRDPENWQFQGSNDGSTWTTLDTQTSQTFVARYQTNSYPVANTTAYSHYRLNITANSGDGSGLQLSELGLYARDTTAPVISVPANMAVQATGTNGAVVTFSTSAMDDGDGSIPTTNSPASGSPFPIGTTSVMVSARDSSGNASTKTFEVTVQPLTAFQNWQLQYFGTTSGTGQAADTADPDGDGVPNLLEYALGTNPTSAASAGHPTVSTAGNHLSITFIRARADVTYLVEVSSDLTSWAVVATNPGSVGQSVTVADPVSLTSGNHVERFIRLQITRP